MRVSTVYACVRVLAESVASLPLHVYGRTKGGGKYRAISHPLYEILHSAPNAEMTSFDLRELLMGSLCLTGNAYHRIYRTRGGQIGELVPIPADTVVVDRAKSGSLVYAVDGDKTLRQSQVWRIPGMGGDGIVGYSPITLAREAIGLALATEQHGATLFGNGAHPGGILETDGVLRDQGAIDRLRSQFERSYSGRNANRPLVLERGLKWRQISMSSDDAQFLETRKFQRTEICSIFRVPPHMIGDLERATFSNIEHQSLEFVMHTLRPWLVRIEQSITRDLISPDERGMIFAEFDVRGLLRGDIKSRYDAYNLAIRTGWMSRNEARKLENLNPVDGLDEYLISSDMMQSDNAKNTDSTN